MVVGGVFDGRWPAGVCGHFRGGQGWTWHRFVCVVTAACEECLDIGHD